MKKNTKIVNPNTYPDYGEEINKKPCKAKEENVTFTIKWDDAIQEKVQQIEAKILASAILVIANLVVGLSALVALIIKK
jgi:O-succinylbenzoate synthase